MRSDFQISDVQFNYLVPRIASAIKGGESKEIFISKIMSNPIMTGT